MNGEESFSNSILTVLMDPPERLERIYWVWTPGRIREEKREFDAND